MEEALRILEMGRTLGQDGEWYPTAVVDVSARPDVADLPRVHALEGAGDLTSYVTAEGGSVLLVVALEHPVVCRFAVEFRLEEHLPLLVDAAGAGHLLIATTPPGEVQNPQWLALYLDRDQLASALADIASSDG